MKNGVRYDTAISETNNISEAVQNSDAVTTDH